MPDIANRDLDELFEALASELRRLDAAPIELCVIGGTALNVLGLVMRPTKDVDVVAIREHGQGPMPLTKARPLPEVLSEAADAVARQFLIEADWLNAGPADLVDHGLPEGFESRLTTHRYGDNLVVHYASRIDQVCFKTFAAADVSGRHLTDLVALGPTRDELRFAVHWIAEQDTLEGFRPQLVGLLEHLGAPDVIDGF